MSELTVRLNPFRLVGMRRERVKLLRRTSLASIVVALSLAASASPSTASVTVGQTAPSSITNSDSYDFLQAVLVSGTSYVLPVNGTLTSWSTYANANGGMLAMEIFRPLGGNSFMAVTHEGPRPLNPSALNTFTGLSVPVKAGDLLGDSTPSSAGLPAAIFPAVPGDQLLVYSPALADGDQAPFFHDDPARVNISAVINPTNSFTLGGVTRNKKKGTATLAFSLPNPGDFSGSGQGAQVVSGPVTSTAVPAGTSTLVVKAKGKKKRKLNEKGKVKVNLVITYTPTGGDPSTQSVKVKLKKRL
jgi:hypothetical protein